MTDFPTSAAKTFLEDWAADEYENAPPEGVLDMLAKLATMVDQEFNDCSPTSEKTCEQKLFEQTKYVKNFDADLKDAIIEIRKKRVALWGVLLSGMKTALARKGQKCAALNNLVDELINRVRGVPVKSAFDIPRKSKVLDHNKVWLRAQIIVVLEKNPARREEIIKNAERLLGIYEPAVSKIVDNFKNGREPRGDLNNLVNTARKYFPIIIDDRLLLN
jgi:hypothetical protein